jgi:hypothetical protein
MKILIINAHLNYPRCSETLVIDGSDQHLAFRALKTVCAARRNAPSASSRLIRQNSGK